MYFGFGTSIKKKTNQIYTPGAQQGFPLGPVLFLYYTDIFRTFRGRTIC
jgi:hypothetical protein